MKPAGRRLSTCLALSLILAVLAVASADAGLFGLWGSRKRVAKPPRRSLVIFPFDKGSEVKTPLADNYGEYVAADLRTMLSGSETYAAFLYRERLAPIERAKVDNVLKTPDYTPPFAQDKAKALKLAHILAADYFLVGEIDDLQVDRANHVAEITLKADLYDAKTGKLVKTFLVTGKTPGSTTTGEEDELRDLAKGAAVTKLVAEFGPPKVEETAPAKPAEPSKPAETTQPAAPPPPPAEGKSAE